ncbi:DUF4383 domain-containing protein [Kribbella sp. NPDC048915]|uniref:DUF4383 domain-containing protein n=1 Tax=Kribbella sp. NPDC048915 TaxID=3155148 RepID=UPI0033FBF6BA
MRSPSPTDRTAPTPTQIATLWIAGAFIALASFGLVRHIDALSPWVPGPDSVVFGLFNAPVTDTVVHFALGAAGLFAAGSIRSSLIFLSATGVLLLLLVAYGQLDPSPPLPGVIPTQAADVVLYVLLAAATVVACVAALAHRRIPVRR